LRNYEREKRLRGGDVAGYYSGQHSSASPIAGNVSSSHAVAWNYQQFSVNYPSLDTEVQVGKMFVRHFLDTPVTVLRALTRPGHTEIFEKLFRRIASTAVTNVPLCILCCKCMTRLYRYCSDLITCGCDDVLLIFQLLQRSTDLELQQSLLDLLDALTMPSTIETMLGSSEYLRYSQSRREAQEVQSSNPHQTLHLTQLLNLEFLEYGLQLAALGHLSGPQLGNLLSQKTFQATSRMLHRREQKRRRKSTSSNDSPGLPSMPSKAKTRRGVWRSSGIGFGSSSSSDSDSSQDEEEELQENEENVNGTPILRASALWVPRDDTCPPTWYVCSQNPPTQIPPPTFLCQGPFRVSELCALWTSGDLDERYLVAPALAAEEAELRQQHNPHVFQNQNDDLINDVDSQFLNFATTNGSGSSDAAVAAQTYASCVDTGRWRPLRTYTQLHVQIMTSGHSRELYSPEVVSQKVLCVLHRVAQVHATHDARGLPFYPAPASRRLLAESSHLAIIASLLLCSEPRVSEAAAAFLCTLVTFNPTANSKLYLTGAFYFAMMTPNSNYHAIANLLDITHAVQATHVPAAALGRDAPPAARSVLASMLPDALINLLLDGKFTHDRCIY
jgi:hypothetical protein